MFTEDFSVFSHPECHFGLLCMPFRTSLYVGLNPKQVIISHDTFQLFKLSPQSHDVNDGRFIYRVNQFSLWCLK